jgi:hypothetical protein
VTGWEGSEEEEMALRLCSRKGWARRRILGIPRRHIVADDDR